MKKKFEVYTHEGDGNWEFDSAHDQWSSAVAAANEWDGNGFYDQVRDAVTRTIEWDSEW